MMVVISALPRNGGTWLMKCIEQIVGGAVLFQPFEGVAIYDDGGMGECLPQPLIVEGTWLSMWMERYSARPCPDVIEEHFAAFVEKYMSHRKEATGVKVTRNLPSVVSAISKLRDDIVVINQSRNIVDAVLSSMRRFPNSSYQTGGLKGYLPHMMRGARESWPDEPWSVVDSLEGDEHVFAERALSMWCLRRSLWDWMANRCQFPCIEVNMEELRTSPMYHTPVIADLLGADPSFVNAVFNVSITPVFSSAVLRPVEELRRCREIADELGIP